jgi:hypothetical protein
MEIESFSGKRYELAMELFSEGKDSLLYKGVLFIRSEQLLQIQSYSDFNLENTTRKMALDKIPYSKSVMNELMEGSKEFKETVTGLVPEFTFCYDYHTGAVAVATEENGSIKWLFDVWGQSKNSKS